MSDHDQRFGRVLRLREGAEEEYDRRHADVWPEVLRACPESGMSAARGHLGRGQGDEAGESPKRALTAESTLASAQMAHAQGVAAAQGFGRRCGDQAKPTAGIGLAPRLAQSLVAPATAPIRLSGHALKAIEDSDIRNYTIFRYQRWLFSYFELPENGSLEEVGQRWAQNDTCRRWEALMQKLQEPLPESSEDNWWVPMREVFHSE